jgi:hypothetical protein
MKTSIWGPSAWKFLHAITFAYPEEPSEEHKEAVKQLFHSLKLLLPCGDCCSHYCHSVDADRIEPHLKSRETLSKWLHEFHNKVNARLNKPQYSYEQAKIDFQVDDESCVIQSACGDSVLQEKQMAKQRSLDNSVLLWVSIAIILLILSLLIFRFSKLIANQAVGK